MLFVLFLIVIAALFVAGWFLVPTGRLTKIVSTIGGALGTLYAALQDQFYLLKEIVPPDYAPWLVGGFLALVIAAAVRPGKA